MPLSFILYFVDPCVLLCIIRCFVLLCIANFVLIDILSDKNVRFCSSLNSICRLSWFVDFLSILMKINFTRSELMAGRTFLIFSQHWWSIIANYYMIIYNKLSNLCSIFAHFIYSNVWSVSERFSKVKSRKISITLHF